MHTWLTIISGVFWIFVYAESIQIVTKEKKLPLPVIVIFLNLSWELIYSTGGIYLLINNLFKDHLTAQICVNSAYLIMDAILLYYIFKEQNTLFKSANNSGRLWLFFMYSLAYQNLYFLFFDHIYAGTLSAYIQNLLMSVLFIYYFFRKRESLKFSRSIAVNKFIGTVAPTISLGLAAETGFPFYLGIACFVIDLIYIYVIFMRNNINKS